MLTRKDDSENCICNFVAISSFLLPAWTSRLAYHAAFVSLPWVVLTRVCTALALADYTVNLRRERYRRAPHPTLF